MARAIARATATAIAIAIAITKGGLRALISLAIQRAQGYFTRADPQSNISARTAQPGLLLLSLPLRVQLLVLLRIAIAIAIAIANGGARGGGSPRNLSNSNGRI